MRVKFASRESSQPWVRVWNPHSSRPLLIGRSSRGGVPGPKIPRGPIGGGQGRPRAAQVNERRVAFGRTLLLVDFLPGLENSNTKAGKDPPRQTRTKRGCKPVGRESITLIFSSFALPPSRRGRAPCWFVRSNSVPHFAEIGGAVVSVPTKSLIV